MLIVDIISDVNMAYSEHARRYLADTGLLKAVAGMHTHKKYKVHIYGDGIAYNTCKQLVKN